MTVTIEHYKVLPGTPGLRLAVRCWHELLGAGLIGVEAEAGTKFG
jgi:hypothetical protein